MNKIFSQIKTFFILFLYPVKGSNHRERLEYYFSNQKNDYDETRRHILPGRDQLYQMLAAYKPSRWIDYGGGTGANFDSIKNDIPETEIHILDLSPSLLSVAEKRIKNRQWQNIHLHEVDIEKKWEDDNQADMASMSYSLSMTKHWFHALSAIHHKLKPHGIIGIVDFYVADKHETRNELKQSWFYRHMVPLFFTKDNVFLKSDYHLYLRTQYKTVFFEKRTHRYPWTPLKIDYFIFIGKK